MRLWIFDGLELGHTHDFSAISAPTCSNAAHQVVMCGAFVECVRLGPQGISNQQASDLTLVQTRAAAGLAENPGRLFCVS